VYIIPHNKGFEKEPDKVRLLEAYIVKAINDAG
jgi:hypothetical protein